MFLDKISWTGQRQIGLSLAPIMTIREEHRWSRLPGSPLGVQFTAIDDGESKIGDDQVYFLTVVVA
jgi:hypothetical protein